MKKLSFLIAFLCVTVNAVSETLPVGEQFLVLDIKGPAQASRPFHNDHWRVHKQDLLAAEWQLTGESTVQITVLCQDHSTATLVRNQYIKEACLAPIPARGDSLIRYRGDQQMANLPVLIRPRSEKVLNLFPIRWRFDNRARVDIYANDTKSGHREKIAVGVRGSRYDQSPIELAPGTYQLDICRAGSRNLCATRTDKTSSVYWLNDRERAKHFETLQQLTLAIVGPYSMDADYLAALYLLSQQFYDDALDRLQRNPAPTSQNRALAHNLEWQLGLNEPTRLRLALTEAVQREQDISAVSLCQLLRYQLDTTNQGEQAIRELIRQFPRHCVPNQGSEHEE